ncbi:MAG: helix-turn-helix domain-containing protein [Ruminococcus sp.]|nr:helix-turn-helix domain-containing protein [Ruminococcus sp.]MDD6710070.1 helix-turn-helix domain-containing protein [Ruminococcus sp.]
METLKHKPYMKLKGKMREKDIITDDLAKLLNLSTTSVLQKINGQSDFFLSEATKIVTAYDLDYDIFLG